MSLTRLFYVLEGDETNPELFETLEGAKATAELIKDDNPIITICAVKNAYREDNDEWNYNDLSDTFTVLLTIE